MSHNKYMNIIHKGKTIKEWADINGLNTKTVYQRLKNGWTVEKAITEAPHNKESKRFIK